MTILLWYVNIQTICMIKSFKSKEVKKIFDRKYSRSLPPTIQRMAMRKLWMIDAATCLSDLSVPPANYLKKLKGKKKEYYSIRINDQWRICFIWQGGDAYDLKIVDYH